MASLSPLKEMINSADKTYILVGNRHVGGVHKIDRVIMKCDVKIEATKQSINNFWGNDCLDRADGYACTTIGAFFFIYYI